MLRIVSVDMSVQRKRLLSRSCLSRIQKKQVVGSNPEEDIVRIFIISRFHFHHFNLTASRLSELCINSGPIRCQFVQVNFNDYSLFQKSVPRRLYCMTRLRRADLIQFFYCSTMPKLRERNVRSNKVAIKFMLNHKIVLVALLVRAKYGQLILSDIVSKIQVLDFSKHQIAWTSYTAKKATCYEFDSAGKTLKNERRRKVCTR